MSKRKRFGVSQALSQGLSDTISLVENKEGVFRNAVIPLPRVELDPDNPRRLTITIHDITQGLKRTDPDFVKKHSEYESIKLLSQTIKERGLIQPIAVYKHGENYRVVAGNRRYLATILAGKKQIEARVFNERPKPHELKIVQWIENTAREDLVLADRIHNINEICKTVKANRPELKLTASLISEMTGLSASQSKAYWRVIKADEQLRQAVEDGRIQSLDKASLLADIADSALLEQAVKVGQQLSHAELKKFIKQTMNARTVKESKAKKGRPQSRINLGYTTRTQVVKDIVTAVLQHASYSQLTNNMKSADWNDPKAVTRLFKGLVTQMEKIAAEDS